MIQSDIFDSADMDINKLINSILDFIKKRLIEILGLIISTLGILLFLSLISYSPEDPNFIFPENYEIKNFLGFRGSFVSDLFFQSLGLITFLIPISFIAIGLSIIRIKKILFAIENVFYIVVYSSLGAFFFNHYYKDAFKLYINGNGGFVGKYLNETFLSLIIKANESISFYILILVILFFFLLSANFNIKSFILIVKKVHGLFKRENKNYTNENEVIKEYIPQDEIKNLIQEDLPFIKAENVFSKAKSIFKLPSVELLKIPQKNERSKSSKNDNIDPAFLEKILLDFGVNGNIKKVSRGPVVTLNEF